MRARSWTRIFPILSFELLYLLLEPAPTSKRGPPLAECPVSCLPLLRLLAGLRPGFASRCFRPLVVRPGGRRALGPAPREGAAQGRHEIGVPHRRAGIRLGEGEAGADLLGALPLPLV